MLSLSCVFSTHSFNILYFKKPSNIQKILCRSNKRFRTAVFLVVKRVIITHQHSENRKKLCTNQQPPQRGGAVPDTVWVESKWLLAFPRVLVTPGTLLHFLVMLPPGRLQKGSTQHLQNRSPVFSFPFLLAYSCPSSSPHSFSFLDER